MIAVLLVICSIATYTDLKELRIPNKLNALLLVLGIVNCLIYGEMRYCFIALLILICLWPWAIGEGDKKLIAIMPLFLWQQTAVFLFFFSILYLLYWVTRKAGKVRPLAPAILLSLVAAIAEKML